MTTRVDTEDLYRRRLNQAETYQVKTSFKKAVFDEGMCGDAPTCLGGSKGLTLWSTGIENTSFLWYLYAAREGNTFYSAPRGKMR